MPTFIFVPRCMQCREPAAVVDEGKYFCGSCFLERTVERQVPSPAIERPRVKLRT